MAISVMPALLRPELPAGVPLFSTTGGGNVGRRGPSNIPVSRRSLRRHDTARDRTIRCRATSRPGGE